MSDFLLFKKILTILSYDLFFLKAMVDMEMLLLVLVILGIGALLGISMIIPDQTKDSCFLKSNENWGRSFSWGFFIGMLFPILVFFLLGGFGYVLCTRGYCNLGNIVPLLSALGILWISFIAIKFITPFFVVKTVNSETVNYRTSKRAQSTKNLTNYVMYALFFSLLLFSLLFVNVDLVVNRLRNVITNFWLTWKFLETSYFEKTVSWIFYILNISALIWVIATLKTLASDTERKGNQYFQEERLREFESKIRGY